MEKKSGIIILGTSSDAGKSFITAALCRLLVNENITVAPFKSLNMTSDVVLIDEGHFIGKSTYEQAIAAKVKPSILMNPILLRPNGGKISVSLLGEVVEGFHGRDFRHKFYYKGLNLINYAVGKIKNKYDVIVLEGSGSPVEMNLKERELVNMKVAELIDVPAILVADIDRGGVFASIVGTIELLSKSERSRVKGIIINKFRGDPSLFADGVRFIEEKVRIPIIGIVPHMDEQMYHGDSFDRKANFVKQHIDFTMLKNIIFQWGNK